MDESPLTSTTSPKVVTVCVPNFTRTFMERLWHSFLNNYKVDVEITCQGHSVRAHQLVLALFCSTFKKTFDITDSGEHRLDTKLLNFDEVVERGGDLELLIEFIYRGSVTLPEEQLDSLRRVAATLEFRLLLEAIEQARNPPAQSTSASTAIPQKEDDQSDEDHDETDKDSTTTTRMERAYPSANRRKRRKPIPRKLYLLNADLSRGQSTKLRGGSIGKLSATRAAPPTGTAAAAARILKRDLRKSVLANRQPLRRSKTSTKDQPSELNRAINQEDCTLTSSSAVDCPTALDADLDNSASPCTINKQSANKIDPVEQQLASASAPMVLPLRKRKKALGTGAGGRSGQSKVCMQVKQTHRTSVKMAVAEDPSLVDQEGEKATRAEYKKSWRQSRPLLKCPLCNYETQDKESYRSHLAKHDPSAQRFVCDVCSKKFRSKRGFLCHCRGHQGPDNLHLCPRCPFQTPQKSSWTQHLAVIHQIDQQGNALPDKFKCHLCNYSCVADHKLKAHVLRKHTAEKPYKCAECDYATFLKYDLEKHVVIRHRHERNYMCETCGFRSQTQSGYARHRRSHTGEKPFRCVTCGQVYADGRKLRIHLQRHLSDEKPFVCHLCGHSCRRKDNLQMHLRRIHKSTLDGDGHVAEGGVVVVEAQAGAEHQQAMTTSDEIVAAMAAAASVSAQLEEQMRSRPGDVDEQMRSDVVVMAMEQEHFEHRIVTVGSRAECDKMEQEMAFVVSGGSVTLPVSYLEYHHVPI